MSSLMARTVYLRLDHIQKTRRRRIAPPSNGPSTAGHMGGQTTTVDPPPSTAQPLLGRRQRDMWEARQLRSTPPPSTAQPLLGRRQRDMWEARQLRSTPPPRRRPRSRCWAVDRERDMWEARQLRSSPPPSTSQPLLGRRQRDMWEGRIARAMDGQTLPARAMSAMEVDDCGAGPASHAFTPILFGRAVESDTNAPGRPHPPHADSETGYTGPPSGHVATGYTGPASGHVATGYTGPASGHVATGYTGPPSGQTETVWIGAPPPMSDEAGLANLSKASAPRPFVRPVGDAIASGAVAPSSDGKTEPPRPLVRDGKAASAAPAMTAATVDGSDIKRHCVIDIEDGQPRLLSATASPTAAPTAAETASRNDGKASVRRRPIDNYALVDQYAQALQQLDDAQSRLAAAGAEGASGREAKELAAAQDWVAVIAKLLTDEQERERAAPPRPTAAAAAAPRPPPALLDLPAGAADQGTAVESELCVICLDRRIAAHLTPCGHDICCFACAPAVAKHARCPQCECQIIRVSPIAVRPSPPPLPA